MKTDRGLKAEGRRQKAEGSRLPGLRLSSVDERCCRPSGALRVANYRPSSASHLAVAVGLFFLLLLLALPRAAGAAPAGRWTEVNPTPSSVSTLEAQETLADRGTPTAIAPHNQLTDQGFEGWESSALAELAGVLGWPSAVSYDSGGRLRVADAPLPGEWSYAHIRAFVYPAAAEAALLAEKEDARLGGYEVSPETFYTYPAYFALLRDHDGAVVEQRFHWLAGTWILGIDLHREAQGSRPGNPHVVAEQLLAIAVRWGLPTSDEDGVPTPDPTWGLPPIVTPTAGACDVTFSDVAPSYWAYTYIRTLACGGIVSGYSNGSFRPENPTTRAQLAKMLVLARRWPLVNPTTQSFSDVGSSHPFYRYIETAAARRVVSGYGDGKFRPDSFVTRAQVAKMVVVARGWSTQAQGQPVTFDDLATYHWAWSYVQAALRHGVFTGYGSSFRPESYATRAQLAKILALTGR
jgi:hypothetical protein